MNFLSILELFAHALPALAQVTIAVLHSTGADQHKTIAGQVADGLTKAGGVATLLHATLLNGVQTQQGAAPISVPPLDGPSPGPP